MKEEAVGLQLGSDTIAVLSAILREEWAPDNSWESQFSLQRAGPTGIERTKNKLSKLAS